MNREEILAKGRAENKNKDLYEQEILKQHQHDRQLGKIQQIAPQAGTCHGNRLYNIGSYYVRVPYLYPGYPCRNPVTAKKMQARSKSCLRAA